MIKRVGWSAIIYDADWCHFVGNQDGIYISDDRLMCETLDDDKEIIEIECDDNDSTDQRTCHILFKQKTTGDERKAVVVQNGGETIMYELVHPSSAFGVCTTYDEFLSLIDVKKKVGDDVTLLNKNEYVILSPTRSDYALTPSDTVIYIVEAFIIDENEIVTGTVTRNTGDTSISTSSETLTEIAISGYVSFNTSEPITEVIPFSSLYPDICQCVTKIEPKETLTCQGGDIQFEVKKYNCMPDKTVTHYDIDVDISGASAITNVLKEYFETSLCDGSQVGYSAVTESGYTDFTRWEIANNQSLISPVRGDISGGDPIHLTAQDGVTSFNFKLISELSGVTSSKIITHYI